MNIIKAHYNKLKNKNKQNKFNCNKFKFNLKIIQKWPLVLFVLNQKKMRRYDTTIFHWEANHVSKLIYKFQLNIVKTAEA